MGNTDPIKVGVLFSETSVTSVPETTQPVGTLFALEEVNSRGGVDRQEVVPVLYDPRSEPSCYAVPAERMITVDASR